MSLKPLFEDLLQTRRQYNITVQGRVRGRGAQPAAGQGEGGCDQGQEVRVHQAGLRPPQVQLHGPRHALPLAGVHQTKLQEEYSMKNQYYLDNLNPRIFNSKRCFICHLLASFPQQVLNIFARLHASSGTCNKFYKANKCFPATSSPPT